MAGRLSGPETVRQRSRGGSSDEHFRQRHDPSDRSEQEPDLGLIGFAITFWAWNIIAPLGTRYSAELGLSATQTSLLVAMPVLVGSLGCVPVER